MPPSGSSATIHSTSARLAGHVSVSYGGKVRAPSSIASVIRTFASAAASGPATRSGSPSAAACKVATTSASGADTTKASLTIEPALCSTRTTAVRA